MRRTTKNSQLPKVTQKLIAQQKIQKILRDKHKDKKIRDLTDADVIEFMRLKMAEELGLEV